jgi:hypothetical protein
VQLSGFALALQRNTTGEFDFTPVTGDIAFDPSELTITLGNGDGTYYPQNSPTIISASVIDEPGAAAMFATIVVLLFLGRRRATKQASASF